MKKLNTTAFREYVENDGETCLVVFSRKSCHVCQGIHGILDDLEAAGIQEGDTVRMYGLQFDYYK